LSEVEDEIEDGYEEVDEQGKELEEE